jgi:hypothetical protein
MKHLRFLLLLTGFCTHALAADSNLLLNPGFDDPNGRGWNARDKPITLDPQGAYQTPCLRVVTPKGDKYPGFYFVSSDSIPAKPNRTYTFKVLVKTAHTAGVAQPSIRLLNAEGKSAGYITVAKLDPGTRDWQTCEITFTTPPGVAGMQVYLIHRDMVGTVWYDECQLIESPPKPMPPIGNGAAVTFDGGPGALPMLVEKTEIQGGRIRVQTTGADFVVDTKEGRIQCSQRIEAQRPVIEIRFPRGLNSLRVVRQDKTVCVLSTGKLDLGIQCDSLIVIAASAPQPVTCASPIAGKWARYEQGNVLAIDDLGGVGIYPHVIPGSGAQVEVPTMPDLSKAGWTCTHNVGGSVRLGVSIFPSRPYDWEKSFTWRLCHTGGACPPDNVLEKWSQFATHVCLHASAMWEGPQEWCGPYKHRDAADFRRCIVTCRRLGMTVIPYMSPWYYRIRDVDAFMKELTEQKAEYGFGGIYYDGLWYDDWIESYRVMRRTRELFRDGCVYIHTTIGPPLWSKTMWCPFMDTYADLVLRGEGYAADGPSDPYIRYVAAGYRTSNAIGMLKGDKWKGVDAKRQLEIMLSYNGRGRWGTYPGKAKDGQFIFPGQKTPLKDLFTDFYFPELKRLEGEWRAKR